MTTFAMLALLFGADLESLVAEDVNAYRYSQGLVECVIDDRLSHAASLHVEWLAFSASGQGRKYDYPKTDHNTNADWLMIFHPELRWEILTLRYSGQLPEQLGAFDLAALCGYDGGFLGDIGYFGKRPSSVDVVSFWIGSPGHRRYLDWPTMRAMGVAKGPVGGKTAVFCFLAEP